MFNTSNWLAYGATSNKFNNTYIQGILDICGNIVLRNGGFSLPNGDVSMNGNLYVGLDTTMRGNVNIQGNLVVNERVLQTLSSDPSYNNVNGYYALADNVQPIVSKQTAYDIGQNWQSAVSGVLENQWVSVCWSSELGLFCAVANTGTTNGRVMVSSDGLTWRNATDGVLGNNWSSVCWSPELGKFCAVATNGTTNNRVMTSSDGLNWSIATGGVLGNNWTSVCWSPELGKFCAVAQSGNTNQRVMISSDGLNWQNAVSGVLDNDWFAICWSPELNLFCSVGPGANADIVPTANQKIMVSNDGLNWINPNINTFVAGSSAWRSICWSSELGLFCSVGNNTVYTQNAIMISNDGLNWINAIVGSPATNVAMRCVCWSTELMMFCAGADTGNAANRIIVSKDGLYWTKAINGTLANSWKSICWSPELSTFCAVGESGTTNERVMITNQEYRLPTTKSIKTLLNDGNYNIKIASASSGTFPNFRTTATGPNLISIGNSNYQLVGNLLSNSIAIGTTILNGNPSGYGMIGMGQNIVPVLTNGFQNIGIGNAIATTMATGYNNVFIGNNVATSTTSTGNTVAIGTNAGRINTTGINNTYLGAFSGANAGTYSNSTAIGYAATINASNQIVLGTLTEHVRTPGNPYWYSGLSQTNKLTFAPGVDIAIEPAPSTYQNSFSNNRITIYNTYFLVVPEFAYGIYRAQLNLNINSTNRSDAYYFKIYQYAYANATTSNIISTGITPKTPVNSLLYRAFEFLVGVYTNDSSIDHSCLFQYAPGTTNRAFLFTWQQATATGGTGGDLDYTNAGANIWSWITLYKVA